MKFIHLSDLHLGKSIYGVSLIENKDQVIWVTRFLDICRSEKPDAVLIAGDVYDRGSPSQEAVALFDYMLTELAEAGICVLMVSGNHDSGERLSFAGSILAKQNVYIAGRLDKKLSCVTLEDKDNGEKVNFWLMPYLFPSLVAQKLEDETIKDYDTAVRKLLGCQDIHANEINVLVAHQNVVAKGHEQIRGGSESMVGGVGQIEYTAFDAFDYVALGHIHAAYSVGREQVRYAGSPMHYHFDEIKQAAKGPLLIEIGKKGEPINHKLIEIEPIHPMRIISGTWDEVKQEFESGLLKSMYLRVEITDSKITPEISDFLRQQSEKLESVLMELLSTHREYQSVSVHANHDQLNSFSLEQLFEAYYMERKGEVSPSDEEMAILKEAGELTRKSRIDGQVEPSAKDIDTLLKYVLKQEA